MTLRVVIAPDSFKGTVSAADAARAISSGWAEVRPQDSLRPVPQADGGEGTLDAIRAAMSGAEWRDAGKVTGPDGRPVPGRWVALPDGVAVVELAQCSGLPLMSRLDPLGATTAGLGEIISAALADGASRIVIGLGGSASTDGGAGALQRMGLGLFDPEWTPISFGGGGLATLDRVDRSGLLPAPPGGVLLLTDVDAPLTGPRGAAAVFGPQKGATPHQVRVLDVALTRFAAVLGGDTGFAGAGAAGGAAFGFVSAWGATVASGADTIAKLTGLGDLGSTADIVITGEGRFDTTSLGGKVVGRMLARATSGGVRSVVVAGSVDPAALESRASRASLTRPPRREPHYAGGIDVRRDERSDHRPARGWSSRSTLGLRADPTFRGRYSFHRVRQEMGHPWPERGKASRRR